MAEMTLTDEQRVTLFLALRMSNPDMMDARQFRTADIQDECRKFWSAIGVDRSPSTWERALRRAKSEGMLGRVTEKRLPGFRWRVYNFDAELDDMLMNVGPAYQIIAHGNRSSAAARKGSK